MRGGAMPLEEKNYMYNQKPFEFLFPLNKTYKENLPKTSTLKIAPLKHNIRGCCTS
jgi:hypothetical protein